MDDPTFGKHAHPLIEESSGKRSLTLHDALPRPAIALLSGLLCAGAAAPVAAEDPDPDLAPLTVVEEALTRARLGEALMAENRWDEALTQLAAVTRIAPTWSFGQTLLAQARRGRGLDHGPTLAALQVAVDLAPRSPRALRELASVLHDLGRHREAVEVWTTLTELSPRDAGVHAKLGQLALEIGDLPTARTHLRVAGGLDRTDRVSRSRLAQALELSHDVDAAEVQLRALAHESPNDPWRWERLYRFLDRHDRPRDLKNVLKRLKAARKARSMKRRRLRPLRSPVRR